MTSNSYNSTFGGQTVFPAQVPYNYVIVNAPQAYPLQWPTDNNTLLNSTTFGASLIWAPVMDINCTNASGALLFPSTAIGSFGSTSLVNNVGSAALTVQNSLGGAICVIPPNTQWIIYFGQFNPNWIATQLGSSTTTANAAALAGAGLFALGVTLNQNMPVVSTATNNYTFVSADLAKLYVWNGGVGALDLPQTTLIGASFFVGIKNGGNGTLSIVPNGTDNINGLNATFIMNPGDSALFVTDGNSNWWTIGFGNTSQFRFQFQLLNMNALSGTYTLGTTGGSLNQIYYRFTGALAGNLTFVVPSSVQQYWIDNETTGGTVTVGTSGQVSPPSIVTGQKAIYACDGVNITIADSSGIPLPLTVPLGGTGATTASQALVNLGGGAVGIPLFQSTTAAAAQSLLNVPDASTILAEAIGIG